MQCHGLQCGFCTPGMMMTARALLDRNPDPTEAEIREAISGQICRCTGYATIVRSVQLGRRARGERPPRPRPPITRSRRDRPPASRRERP